MKKGSGISKKAIIVEIATQIPSKPAVKVGYKYDNLLKSYRAAAKLNNQSGWGLSEGDLNTGRRYLRDKLLSQCLYFFRLEQILGDWSNVRPPALYDSGCEGRDTTSAVKALPNAIARPVRGRGGRDKRKEAKEQEGEGKENEEEVERYGEESKEAEEEVGINWDLGEKEEVEEIQEGEREEVVFEGEEYSEERGEIREEEGEGSEVRRKNREDGQGRQGDGN
ncbi:hypothetical protein L873DRAFT_1842777 [Choiromyces venosus 120613-1]|uniref:Uncharacterized protein n=1 Tax=Choiromyces venosus 120613-1 TaxID=1336337 RepID=A0A3N4K4E6_9PEZI|nr:hypothetical protein L873DRAFT_1842777 [Choiromyces venosus 120613-1]